MYTKEEAFSYIAALVERFHEQLPSYKKSDYNETLTRKDFIDPFFMALGWDMNNSAGNAEAYREVIHEDKIRIGSATKAPDYSFRLPGGKRLFFVEAKKPSVYVKDEILPAYQVRRYAWSAKLPVSILTDFEEFAVYDCKKKPNISDKASASRIKYITYKDYLTEFDFIWNNFSKEKVLKGGFDKYVQSDSNKKGTSTVDKEFLVSLDEWRKELAQNIALRNTHLNEDEINFTVQQTLDRLIFLRIAEDRGVEEYGRLKASLTGDVYYQNLFKYFKEADNKYNSGLFDFRKDRLSAGIVLDNKIIKSILSELYYPASPYEFSVLSVEILGSAYEQFLGKQIRLTPSHKAVIEEKPEVRKAGGVYYTPEYIVEYIVKNTVGKLTEGLTPKQIESLKIVDPACGSGSFLIGAYQYLLNYHQQYYKPKFDELSAIAASNQHTGKQRNDAIKEKNRLPLTPDGNLTTDIKKQILLNNIFGVDIDAQAVEVTKLSLMLKCMEGETKSSINAQLNFGERVLPTLDDNIKCGNSLIDVDFYDGQLDFEPGIEKKVKPFSWEKAFPKVFKDGGFDCVIGNPPYIRVQLLNDSKDSLKYFEQKYKSAEAGNYDIYVLFIEKALNLLNQKGLSGYILPHKFFNSKYGKASRELISKGMNLKEIIHFGDKQIFSGATTYTCLLFLSKTESAKFCFTEVDVLDDWKNNIITKTGLIAAETVTEKEWNFSTGNDQELFNKLNAFPIKLGDISKIFVGLQTSADTIFLFKNVTKSNGKTTKVFSKELNDTVEIENDLLKEVVRSGQIGNYWINPTALVLFPYYLKNEQVQLIDEKKLKSHYPFAWLYLNRNKHVLEQRENGKFKSTGWYQLYPKNLNMWEEPKIMIPYMIKELAAYYDTAENYFVNVTTGGFGLRPTIKNISPYFITALLNSKVLNWFLKKVSTNFNSGYFAANKQFLVQLPIQNIDKKNQRIHDEIVSLVETMLQLQKEKQQTTLPHKLDQLKTRIEYTDEKINKLVFELYGLGEEERGIVEEVSSL